jgi:hypothetical protein
VIISIWTFEKRKEPRNASPAPDAHASTGKTFCLLQRVLTFAP